MFQSSVKVLLQEAKSACRLSAVRCLKTVPLKITGALQSVNDFRWLEISQCWFILRFVYCQKDPGFTVFQKLNSGIHFIKLVWICSIRPAEYYDVKMFTCSEKEIKKGPQSNGNFNKFAFTHYEHHIL